MKGWRDGYAKGRGTLSPRDQIAKTCDVPPWYMAGGPDRPPFARLRWKLRRIVPGLVWKKAQP